MKPPRPAASAPLGQPYTGGPDEQNALSYQRSHLTGGPGVSGEDPASRPCRARLDQDLAPLRFSVDREGALLRAQAEEDLPEDLGARVSAVVEEMGSFAVEMVDTEAAIPRWFGFAGMTRKLTSLAPATEHDA